MMRPSRLIAVVGTHTDVGKTWVAQALLRQLRAHGMRVAARKPVQSYELSAIQTDAEQIAAATGEHPHVVCPPHRWYPRALAPPMAADVLRRPRIELKELLAEITWPEHVQLGVVETVGGVRSPVAHDGDSVDLVRGLQPDHVLLVADAGLGALNAIRLSLACLGAPPAEVFLNRFDPANPVHRLNQEWLAEHYGIRSLSTIDALTQRYQCLTVA